VRCTSLSWAFIATALLGCDDVFDLEHVHAQVCPSPIGHDEDGDRIDDACDRCPMIANASDPDGDGDGVGEACDPDPARACEERLMFDGFGLHRPALVVTGDWRVEGDDLVRPDPASVGAFARFPDATFADVRARAALLITGFDTTAMTSHFKLATGATYSLDAVRAGYGCSLHRLDDTFALLLTDETAQAPPIVSSLSGDPMSELVIEVDNRRGSPLRCAVNGAMVQASVVAPGLAAMTVGEVMFYTDDVGGRVHWLDVLGTRCP
jgi:hypothetical protein